MRTPYSFAAYLEGKLCVVIGGGMVAERKVLSLLEANAVVRLISPKVTEKLRVSAEEGLLEWLNRSYGQGDIKDAVLVFAATNQPVVNKQVFQDTDTKRQWINVADHPEWSNFFVPSVVRRGRLLLSVSTGGSSPSVAKRISTRLSLEYGDEYEWYLDFLSRFRDLAQENIVDMHFRQSLLRAASEWPVLQWIQEGIFQQESERVFQLLQKEPHELLCKS